MSELAPDDFGLARQRTTMAWTRTGISFGVSGAFLLRVLGDEGSSALGLAVALVALGSVAWLWGWRVPEARPAVDTRLGRSTVRTIGLGTAAIAVLAMGDQLVW